MAVSKRDNQKTISTIVKEVINQWMQDGTLGSKRKKSRKATKKTSPVKPRKSAVRAK